MKTAAKRALPVVPPPVDPERCRRCANIAPWYSFWGNFALAVHKLIVGILGRSTALVADAVHSFGDVLGSSSILVATRVGAREPDARFPYGRGKAEFVGAVFVYIVLLFFAGGIIISSIRSMLSGEMPRPHYVTAAAAVVSVLYNYLMYKFATCAGVRNNSPAILADAFENRADALSSVAVIFGIAAAHVIHPICDTIAALIVGVIIFWNCQEQLREAARGLMDRGMEEDRIEAIKRAAGSQEGVSDVVFVRTRQTGVRYWIDLGIRVPEGLSVEQADEVASAVRDAVASSPQCHYVEVYTFPSAAEAIRSKAESPGEGPR